MTDSRLISPDYTEFLESIKERVRNAQVKAALSINRELVLLYWEMGREILSRQQAQGWGAKVIDQLSQDLKSTFPEMKGFSPRNLKYMKAFFEAWPDPEKVQQLVAQIPWGHLVRILDKASCAEERLFYVQKTIENGWSRNILVLHMERSLFRREGKAITNFETTLPSTQSDLVPCCRSSRPPFVEASGPLTRRADEFVACPTSRRRNAVVCSGTRAGKHTRSAGRRTGEGGRELLQHGTSPADAQGPVHIRFPDHC